MGLLTGTVLVIFVLACLFLIFLVMIQTGKGGMGGMFGGGGSSQSPFGSGTADIMTTTTKYTAIIFMILSLLLSWLFAKKQGIMTPSIDNSSIIQPVEEKKSNEESPTEETTP